LKEREASQWDATIVNATAPSIISRKAFLAEGNLNLLIEIAGQRYTQQTIIIIPEHPLRHDVTFRFLDSGK
jgi:hypothetical protein